MALLEKQTTYTSTNSYATLNKLTAQTMNIWIVLHGIGYLSRYFLRYFDELDAAHNYIIAPQAPSKYYLKNEYRHVGASWLTKENTQQEIENVLAYLDGVMAQEDLPADRKLIILGFSQGVSIATRWMASRKLPFNHLILYAGGIPKELVPEDFDFLDQHKTKVSVLVGNKDEYLTPAVLQKESVRIDALFKGRAVQTIFEGGHEVKKELLHQFA
ncbi:esterase [Aggregatimonas sangjinii]|uniref:Esterase n=1 Tax=Aggregatimonas sangjinii TaxID=2583587 RepID=A0A5B7ST44_9FLAO|nr:esterase [Aggregatimonas sangjinii]QCX00193.1 esterase [Aggregatimonas sangjinii]